MDELRALFVWHKRVSTLDRWIVLFSAMTNSREFEKLFISRNV